MLPFFVTNCRDLEPRTAIGTVAHADRSSGFKVATICDEAAAAAEAAAAQNTYISLDKCKLRILCLWARSISVQVPCSATMSKVQNPDEKSLNIFKSLQTYNLITTRNRDPRMVQLSVYY